jgi:hypothetical protein
MASTFTRGAAAALRFVAFLFDFFLRAGFCASLLLAGFLLRFLLAMMASVGSREVTVSANEIAERIAAHAWVRLGPASGEGIGQLNPSDIGFRSQVGFNNTIIGSDDMVNFPLLILTLDRELSRKQNQVIGYSVVTVDAAGRSYPPVQVGQGVGPVLPAFEPIHTDWIGDPTAPSWLPFSATIEPVPNFAQLDLDRFNAIAVSLAGLETEGGVSAYSGDFCILVLASPIQEAPSTFSAIIPAPGP